MIFDSRKEKISRLLDREITNLEINLSEMLYDSADTLNQAKKSYIDSLCKRINRLKAIRAELMGLLDD